MGSVLCDGDRRGARSWPARNPSSSADSRHEQTAKEFNAEIGLILGMMKPRFFSYRSGHLVFDSAVFQSHARGLDRAPAHLQEVKKKAEIAIAQNIAKNRSPELARAIAATLAVRTRRLHRR